MDYSFADRMNHVPKSFIREILKVTENPEIISFAGGLPNPKFFPVQEIMEATTKVLQEEGQAVLQYSTTEGYLPLREYIAQRYSQKYGLTLEAADILITTGSQQGLDLIGKLFLEPGDSIIMERPGYLGAIQAFSMFRPDIQAVPLEAEGIDTGLLQRALESQPCKLFYAVPNFQNPSGTTYTEPKRREVADLLEKYPTIFVEDNPYDELRFTGRDLPLMRCYLENNIILLGSFSKIVSPAFRLGWIWASRPIMEKLVIAKQAADLHSNYFSQRIVYQYLLDHDLDDHISTIREAYGRQRDLMIRLMEQYFPAEATFTRPEGGMFLWVTLPEQISSLDLFEQAAKLKVAFVPGTAFYVDGGGENTLRVNFSNTDEDRIETGVKRLAQAIKTLLATRK